MEMPNVKHELIDDTTNVTYHVLAYRRMSKAEVLTAIRFYLSNEKKKHWPKRNSTVEIHTLFGLRD